LKITNNYVSYRSPNILEMVLPSYSPLLQQMQDTLPYSKNNNNIKIYNRWCHVTNMLMSKKLSQQFSWYTIF